jgi:hypothetical protein
VVNVIGQRLRTTSSIHVERFNNQRTLARPFFSLLASISAD